MAQRFKVKVTLIVLGPTKRMIGDERSDSVVECWTRSRVASQNFNSDTYCAGSH